MTDPDTLTQILQAADVGSRPEDIAVAIGINLSKVYYVLRVHRPERPRAQHRHKFNKTRFAIEGMLGQGYLPGRVAKVLGVSRAYVYRVKGEVQL